MTPARLARYASDAERGWSERDGGGRWCRRTASISRSNDYLGLANSTRLAMAVHAGAFERGVPVGAGGSRLLRGNHPEHEALEAEAAAFFGTPSASYISAAAMPPTSRFFQPCRSAVISSCTTR